MALLSMLETAPSSELTPGVRPRAGDVALAPAGGVGCDDRSTAGTRESVNLSGSTAPSNPYYGTGGFGRISAGSSSFAPTSSNTTGPSSSTRWTGGWGGSQRGFQPGSPVAPSAFPLHPASSQRSVSRGGGGAGVIMSTTVAGKRVAGRPGSRGHDQSPNNLAAPVVTPAVHPRGSGGAWGSDPDVLLEGSRPGSTGGRCPESAAGGRGGRSKGWPLAGKRAPPLAGTSPWASPRLAANPACVSSGTAVEGPAAGSSLMPLDQQAVLCQEFEAVIAEHLQK